MRIPGPLSTPLIKTSARLSDRKQASRAEDTFTCKDNFHLLQLQNDQGTTTTTTTIQKWHSNETCHNYELHKKC